MLRLLKKYPNNWRNPRVRVARLAYLKYIHYRLKWFMFYTFKYIIRLKWLISRFSYLHPYYYLSPKNSYHNSSTFVACIYTHTSLRDGIWEFVKTAFLFWKQFFQIAISRQHEEKCMYIKVRVFGKFSSCCRFVS